jgi:hypothetical protein
MVKVNKVLLSLAGLASVRANEPVYPGDPIPPLAPSVPAKPFFSSFFNKEYLDLVTSFVPADTIKGVANEYGFGSVVEYLEGPQDKSAFGKAVEAYIPGGAAMIDTASSISEQYADYIPTFAVPDYSGLANSASAFVGEYGTYLGSAAALGGAAAAYFKSSPAE